MKVQKIENVNASKIEDVRALDKVVGVGNVDELMKRSIAQEIGYYLYKNNLIDFQIEQNNPFQRKYTANLKVVKYVDVELNEEQLKQKRRELSQLIAQKLIAEVVDYEELEHLHNMVVDNESQMNIAQEEKELLLKDLCGRLPYKPRVRYYYRSMGAVEINGYSDESYLSYQNLEDFSIYPKYGLEETRVCNILPYLRPMSSMTESEISVINYNQWRNVNHHGLAKLSSDIVDYCNQHHLDYRGLIEKGLALEAPKDMYK